MTDGSMTAPEHIAIIMDGNGRWATARGQRRTEGHKAGVETVRRVVEDAASLGVKYITLFGFSSENWNRPEDEVSDIMGLIRLYLKREISELNKNNVCLKVIGDRTRFAKDIREELLRAEEATKDNNKITVTIALSYGGRQDIVFAVKDLVKDALEDKISLDGIDETKFSSYLSTAGVPDPDLVIRTSGEMRVSNFLMWQMAYAELFFTDTLWPDFSKADLEEAIKSYNSRDRRFGKLSKKVSGGVNGR